MAFSRPCLTALLVFLASAIRVYGFVTADELAAQYSLTVSASIPFPTATLATFDTNTFIKNSWSLNKDRIQGGGQDVAFVQDPFPNSFASSSIQASPGPVLQVTYKNGSFGDTDGGAQFLSLFNGSIAPQSMMVSYEVAFDKGFQFVKGGKLPGLRGGPVVDGCEGGSQPNGTDCWSTRLMWRKDGAGEVYAYIPNTNNLCSRANIICNSDFGTSISRGNYYFVPGAWNRVTLLVRLNNPGKFANGNVMLYYNDIPAITQGGLQMRTDTRVVASGLFFSTFFGGSDSSWASTVDQSTYFRNFRIWASASPSNSTASAATPSIASGIRLYVVLGLIMSLLVTWWLELF
ncbi:polysaccharide lyase family 14 protein [Sphaerobolus stellatus SS14]|nr:polysaccharide lyase family 14 protein [Sphaerobolus stellatus SS14]